MQNKETLLQLVERLREAGQRHHDYTYINMVTGVKLCPAAPGGEAEAPCACGAKEHNFSVDAAAKALVAEIEALESVHANRGPAPYPTQAEVDDELNDFRTGSRR